MAFRGAMVHNGGVSFNVANATTGVFLPFSNVAYDTDGFFNPSYPTRLTIPADAVRARFGGQLIFNSNGNGIRQLVIKKNYPAGGGWYPGVPANNTRGVPGTTTDINAWTPWIDVHEGDYFELEPYQDSGGVLPVLGSVGTFFCIEAQP